MQECSILIWSQMALSYLFFFLLNHLVCKGLFPVPYQSEVKLQSLFLLLGSTYRKQVGNTVNSSLLSLQLSNKKHKNGCREVGSAYFRYKCYKNPDGHLMATKRYRKTTLSCHLVVIWIAVAHIRSFTRIILKSCFWSYQRKNRAFLCYSLNNVIFLRVPCISENRHCCF